jgi:hypothetical protein
VSLNTTTGISTRRSNAANISVSAVSNKKSNSSSSRNSKSAKERDHPEEWVQCDICTQWRLLPDPTHPLYPTVLPDK